MNRLARLASFLRSLILRRQFERDMEREWAFHLDARIDDLVTAGLSRTEAEQRARDEFGDTLRWKEQGREARGLRLMDELRQDAVYALRQMARAPGFTFVAVATLALGIGANTAIFSVVNAVLLRPLPYPDSDRLVRFVEVTPAADDNDTPRRRTVGMTVADMATLRSKVTTLSHVGTYGGATMLVTGRDQPFRVDGVRATPEVLEMVRARAFIGRTFEPRETTVGEDTVVILSFLAWRRYFGGVSDILGQTITLNGQPHTVIGVMPDDFRFPDAQTQLWMPYPVTGPAARGRVSPIARLADGVSLEVATSEVSSILRELPTTAQATSSGAPQFELQSVHDDLVAPVRPALLVLTAAVGFVLLIACVNLVNLIFARTAARRREMAVRLALGAGRGRLARQLLTESILLALAAATVGTGLAFGGLHLLRRLGSTLPRRDMFASGSLPRLDEVGIDASTLLVTLGLAIVTGILAGLMPVLRQPTAQHADALREGASSMISGFNVFRRQRTQGLLIVAEIATAMLLLIGGGLLIRSFSNLASVDPGYDPTNVVTFQVFSPKLRSILDPNPPSGADAQHSATFAAELLSRLEAVPGVRAAGYAELLPMVRFRSGVRLRTTPDFPTAPPPPPAPGAQLPPQSPDTRVVSRDFLKAMGIRIVEGRGFDERDSAGQPQVMLINRTLARSGLLGEHPIGAYVYAIGRLPWQVIGIVDDVHQYGLDQQPDPQIFIDARQTPSSNPNVYYALRAVGEPTTVLPTVRALVGQLDPDAVLDNVATMEQLLSNAVSRPRLYAVLLGIFAAVAVALAAIGIYGVMAYAVVQRTREIGIRMTLGANRSSVTGLVLGQSLVLIGIGTTAGLAGAAATTRYLEGMLFGLKPLDLETFTAVVVLFVAIAISAVLVPARRATRIDPLVALRCD